MEVFPIPSNRLRVDPGVLHNSICVETLCHSSLALAATINVEESCIVASNTAIPRSLEIDMYKLSSPINSAQEQPEYKLQGSVIQYFQFCVRGFSELEGGGWGTYIE